MAITKKLTLLHSNDLHGDFLPERIGGLDVGGVSLLSGYVSEVREKEDNVIYVIAGDMFRGSVIDSEFKGISTIEFMNMLAPDVVTIGNHEIDYGIAHLLFIEKCAQFPIINSNMYITTSGARLFKPFEIIMMDDMKILFIGLITEEVISAARTEGLVGSFINTKEAAEEVGRICNAYNAIDIDFTVLVTHIGIEEDIKLAEMLKPEWGVDIILGGHSHTFMEEPLIVNDIVIAQAGEGTDNIGRFDIIVDTDDNCIQSFTWDFIPINSETAKKDEQLEQLVQSYKDITDLKYRRIITRFPRKLTHPRRNIETQLGSLFSDIFKESLGVDVMFLGSGSIRGDSLGPVVEYQNLAEIFPYDDEIHFLKVTGRQLKDMLHFMLRDESFLNTTEYYQVSEGLTLTYVKNDKEIIEFNYNNSPIKDDDSFSIGLQNFHYQNFEDFFSVNLEEVTNNHEPYVLSTSAMDILLEYLSSHHRLDYRQEKRITIIE